MSAKQFNFSIQDMRAKVEASFCADGEKLEAAFALGVPTLPPAFTDKQLGLRMFRFEFVNTRTAERSAFMGQGFTVLEAWSDACKQTRESFRPSSSGKVRPSNGVPVFLPPRLKDPQAIFRTVARSIESFESDETFDQERARRAREAEAKQLAIMAGRAA